LFDEETLRKIRLTPEGGRGEGEAVTRPANVGDAFNRRPALAICWPDVSDINSAKMAAAQGAAAAFCCAVATTIFVGLAAAGVGPVAGLGIDAWALVGAAILFAIAWGIHEMSRAAAILGLVLYLGDRVIMWSQVGPRGVPVAMMLILAFVNAVRGTFAYREHTSGGSS
jgi:hypothetical protein